MKNLIATFAAAATLFCLGGTVAFTKTVIFNSPDFLPTGDATRFKAFIQMDDGDTGGAELAFTLPDDYAVDSTSTIQLLLMGYAHNCTYSIISTGGYRVRLGKPLFLTNDPVKLGFRPTKHGPTAAPSVINNVGFAKDFELSVPQAGNIKGQKPGDRIKVDIQRQGNSSGDTCASALYLVGGRMDYQAK